MIVTLLVVVPFVHRPIQTACSRIPTNRKHVGTDDGRMDRHVAP